MILLIPAYNPDEKLLKLLNDMKNYETVSILIVNDGSDSQYDATFELAKKYATVIGYQNNSGKGFALKTGLQFIKNQISMDTTTIVTADADGQHTVEDIIKTANAFEKQKVDIMLGVRTFSGKVPFKSLLGNWMTCIFFMAATGKKVTDTQTGLRAFSSKDIPFLLSIKGNRYEYELNVLLKSCEKKMIIGEVAINTIYMDGNQGSHFRVIHDSISIYKELFQFMFSSFSSFLIDFSSYVVLSILTSGLGSVISVIISNVLARGLSGSFNFYMNRNWVFRRSGSIKKEIVKYSVLASLLLGINTVFLTFLVDIVNMNPIVSKIVVEFFIFFLSYFIQKKYVFRQEHEKMEGKAIC